MAKYKVKNDTKINYDIGVRSQGRDRTQERTPLEQAASGHGEVQNSDIWGGSNNGTLDLGINPGEVQATT